MAIWLIKYRYIFRYENAIFHARFIAYDINTFNNHNFQPLTTFQRKKKSGKNRSLAHSTLAAADGRHFSDPVFDYRRRATFNSEPLFSTDGVERIDTIR